LFSKFPLFALVACNIDLDDAQDGADNDVNNDDDVDEDEDNPDTVVLARAKEAAATITAIILWLCGERCIRC